MEGYALWFTLSLVLIIVFLLSGSLLVTAGGNQLCIWDLVGGGRLLRRLNNFQKTVTCVRMSPLAGPDSAAAPRMLAGSLDGHVKVRLGEGEGGKLQLGEGGKGTGMLRGGFTFRGPCRGFIKPRLCFKSLRACSSDL